MLRRNFFVLAAGVLMLAGCSIANSPDDPVAPGNGGGGEGGTGGVMCSEDCTTLGDDCNEGVCVDGSCTTQPIADGTDCDDGLFCTIDDACQAGTCTGTDLVCPAGEVCTTGVCDEDADNCVIAPADEGAECDDGNPCTDTGTCVSGMCQDGADLCAMLDTECSVGVCDMAMGCTAMPMNEGLSCNVGNICGSSLCQSGQCVIVAPLNEGMACDDGQFCTFGDQCMQGICMPGTGAACPESTTCGNWTCDEMTDTCTVMPINNGQLCDDQNQCTPAAQSMCFNGGCAVQNGPLTYLFEDFSDNSAGWVTGPEWGIGPAMPSIGGTPGDDPAFDHTPTADEGVAGVVIGGMPATQQVHPFYYITSPPMNVPPGQTAVLGFYRWLNSDYTRYMQNVIEVWDGLSWNQVWASGSSPGINDTAWTYIEHDLTPWANAEMRVRFGFNIGSTSAYNAGSWNIDDVMISSVPCP